MAIEHMVWIRFHDDVEPERIEAHLKALTGLSEQIEVVESLAVGRNFTDRADGFTHGMIVRLPSRAALQTYLEHPRHVAVAGPLKQDADLRAMDIDVESSG